MTDLHQKVELLTEAAALDAEGVPSPGCGARQADFLARSRAFVTHPQRGKIPVMRVMLTTACEQNCRYCPFRAGRDFRRVWLTPDELAAAFDQMYRKKLVEGLFLTSGIVGGGVKAMDRLLATAELVRRKYRYRGYLHLKVMPGAEEAQIEQAVRLADRLSVNLEGANEHRLPALAPQKDFSRQLLPPLYWLRRHQFDLPPWVKRPGLTTQFVVGPAGESDRELLTTAHRLYRETGLARAYYSAFNPVPDTPFAGLPPTDPTREHRLYQADWLLRFYGFALDDLPFDAGGNLPLTTDPKLLWANRHLSEKPVEINRAGRGELLRVPGIGPKTADAILSARRKGRLTDLTQLRRLGAAVERAAP
ncbi:MAG: radical SAM protein, partial [Chloroflexi bacterium]